MRVLLGACLALLLANGAPAFAAATPPPPGHTSQTGHATQTGHDQATTDANDHDTSAAPQGRRHHRQGDHQRVRHHERYFNHQWVSGERVPPRFLRGRHVITDYARFRVDAPRGGDQWVKARKHLLLVSADGTVKSVIPRHRRHRQRDAGPSDVQHPSPSGSPQY